MHSIDNNTDDQLKNKRKLEESLSGLLRSDEIKNQSYDKTEHNVDKDTESNDDLSRLILFFSFDIVNSTLYKEMTSYWPTIIRSLIQKISADVLSNPVFENAVHLWRLIGDEVVFTLRISKSDDIMDAVKVIFWITQAIDTEIKNGDFFEEIFKNDGESNCDTKCLSNHSLLSVKSAVWLAAVNKNNKDVNDCIQYKVSDFQSERTYIEYQGMDIDTGFRLKKYTHERRVIISYEVAYFIYEYFIKHNENEKDFPMHIMDYVSLKGVWNGHLYPIIWFYDKGRTEDNKMYDDAKDKSFEASFRYDELNECDISKSYLERGISNQDIQLEVRYLQKENMYEIPQAIVRIKRDRGLEKKLSHFKEVIEKSSNLVKSEKETEEGDKNNQVKKLPCSSSLDDKMTEVKDAM